MAGTKGGEKRLAARIGLDDAAVVFQHGADRLANAIVVVDDEDLGAVGSDRSFNRVNRVRHGRGRRLRQEFSIACVSSLNLTGLLNWTQSCRAMSRNASVEMSPVRMMKGIGRLSSCRNF